MKQRNLRIISLLVVAISLTLTVGSSYAQEAEDGQEAMDKAVDIILIAAITGGLVVPILGYATASKDSNNATNPFNWRQYALAVIIVVPITLGIAMMQITTFELTEITKAQSVTLFITVFLQALGIEYAKSRAKKAAKHD